MYSIEEVRMTDPEIAAAIEKEIKRQNDHIELIASENWTLRQEILRRMLCDR